MKWSTVTFYFPKHISIHIIFEKWKKCSVSQEMYNARWYSVTTDENMCLWQKQAFCVGFLHSDKKYKVKFCGIGREVQPARKKWNEASYICARIRVTPSVLSKLNCQEDFKVEIFNKIELMTNLLKSELVPLHKLSEHNFSAQQCKHLPKMFSGSHSKLCGYSVGSVVEILHKDGGKIVKSEKRVVIPAVQN